MNHPKPKYLYELYELYELYASSNFRCRIRSQLLQFKMKSYIHRNCPEMHIFYVKKKVRNLGSYFQSEKFCPWPSRNC
jgi:hypothetical protein